MALESARLEVACASVADLLATAGREPVPPGVAARLVGELGCYLVFELAQLMQDRLVPWREFARERPGAVLAAPGRLPFGQPLYGS